MQVRSIQSYFYNSIPQVILSSYQDKVYMSLVVDPEKIKDTDAFVRHFCEELYRNECQ